MRRQGEEDHESPICAQSGGSTMDRTLHGAIVSSRYLILAIFMLTVGVSLARELPAFELNIPPHDPNERPTAVVVSADGGYMGIGFYVYGFRPQRSVDRYGGFGPIGAPVRLDGAVSAALAVGGGAVFVTTRAGTLYRIDAQTMQVLQQRRMRRAGCATDQFNAAPVFHNGPQIGMVFVATARGCGDHQGNQIIALRADDITAPPLWIVNTGEYELDAFNACVERSRSIYCTMSAQANATTPSVVSVTADTGAIRWMFAAGNVPRAPAIGRAEGGAKTVYVIDSKNRMFELDDGSGALVSSTGWRIVQAITDPAVPRVTTAEDYPGMVFALDTLGRVHAIIGGNELWEWDCRCGVKSLTIPAGLGRGYAADDSGIGHQIELSGGFDEASYFFGSAGVRALTSDLLFYRRPDGQGRLIGAANVVNGGIRLIQYPAPCPPVTYNECINRQPEPSPAPQPAPQPAPSSPDVPSPGTLPPARPGICRTNPAACGTVPARPPASVPPAPPEPARSGVRVISGTYGGNCGQPAGNVTAHLAAQCNGAAVCRYTVDYRVIGDPAPGCKKDYVAKWNCRNGSDRSVRAEAEAGYGSVIELSCY